MKDKHTQTPLPIDPLPCIACQNHRRSFLFKKQEYAIYECSDCGLKFVYPQPSTTELEAIYDDSYFSRGNKYSSSQQEKDPNEVLKLQKIRQFIASGNLLDVGCATGEFLQLAQEQGFHVTGVELSPYAAGIAKKTIHNIHNGELLSAPLNSAQFDLVTLWDVIEHLENPSATLHHVNTLLTEDGLLFLTTGDIGALWARILGRHWQLLTPPQHIFFFTTPAMTRLLQRYGFEIVEIRSWKKQVKLGFALFKAQESFGNWISPAVWLAKKLGIAEWRLSLNLGDMGFEAQRNEKLR